MPRTEPFGTTARASVSQLLKLPAGFRDAPVIQRKSITRSKTESKKVQPAGFVRLALASAGLDVQQTFPQSPQ